MNTQLPTDAELLAAIQKGIQAGTIIEITDEWIADQRAALPVTITDLYRSMRQNDAIAETALALGDEKGAQYAYDDARMDEAEIRTRLAALVA